MRIKRKKSEAEELQELEKYEKKEEDDFDEDLNEDDQEVNDDYVNDELNDNYFDDGLGGYGEPPLKKNADLLKDLTNFNPYLQELVNGWLGYTWSDKEKKFVQDPNLKPTMNMKCASWCVSYLKTYARGNNIITNINQVDYQNMMSDIIEVVWFNIGTRTKEFEISNDGDILMICNELEHAPALVLMGAGDGKYNDFMGSITTRHEQITPNQQQNPFSQQFPIIKRTGTMARIKRVLFGGQ
jgi:hypothetical protein